jgi:uncharacterized protein
MYTKSQLKAQMLSDQTDLASAALKYNVRETLSLNQKIIIQKSTWFVIASVDELGCPNVSIKAGSPGFVSILDDNLIEFKLLSGNGMNLLAGDLLVFQEHEKANNVSLEFCCSGTGEKVRMKGQAILNSEDLSNQIPASISIRIMKVWANCPRFKEQIFHGKERKASIYEAVFPEWKRLDILQKYLTKADLSIAQSLGLITAADWKKLIENGTGDKEHKI